MIAPVRVALAGSGEMGTTHFRTYQRLSDVRVVGALASSPQGRARWEALGVPVFGSLEELAEGAAPDAVDLCTPTDLHPAQAIRALELGCHVILNGLKHFRQIPVVSIERTSVDIGLSCDFSYRDLVKALVSHQRKQRVSYQRPAPESGPVLCPGHCQITPKCLRALPIPSSSQSAVTKEASCLRVSSAFPIAMPRPAIWMIS